MFSSLRSWWQSRTVRDRRLAAGFVGVALLAVIVGLSWVLTNPWKRYDLVPAGIAVDLPAPPLPVEQLDGGVANLVYQSVTPETAVVIARQQVPPDSEGRSAQEVARAALRSIGLMDEISDVRCRTRPVDVGNAEAVRIDGSFRRNGAPARLVGVTATRGVRAWQVFAFFNGPEGAETAAKVMKSVQITE